MTLMIMTMKRYNIVWADDQVHVLYDNFTKDNFEDNGLYLIGEATHSEELDKVLEELCKTNSIHKPDAVIVDANFCRKNIQVEDKSTSGLAHSLSLIEKYPSLPFFLYTKRKREFLLQQYPEGELDYFERQNRWFEKDKRGFEKLIKRIKEVVDEQASPEFKIRNKYPREFQIVQHIIGAEETLLKGLLVEMEEAHIGSVDYFTSLRKIIEGMFEICKEQKIIPEISELNACCTFLENKHSDYYIVEGEKIMHEALVYALRYALDMTQDASHNKKKLKLKTDEYARETKSNHLFFSILHITMDLLLWFGETIENYDEERAALRWEKRNLDEVSIDKIEKKYIAHAGAYRINVNKAHASSLKVGDVVQIKKANKDNMVDWKDYSLKS